MYQNLKLLGTDHVFIFSPLSFLSSIPFILTHPIWPDKKQILSGEQQDHSTKLLNRTVSTNWESEDQLLLIVVDDEASPDM